MDFYHHKQRHHYNQERKDYDNRIWVRFVVKKYLHRIQERPLKVFGQG
jgi:hypothetical protein